MYNINIQCESNSTARVPAFQAGCCGFESRLSLHPLVVQWIERETSNFDVASSTLAEGT